LRGEDEVVEEGNTALAAQFELSFVQGIYFVSLSYLFTMIAHLMWRNYFERVWPMNG
jgi:hypothetical protein